MQQRKRTTREAALTARRALAPTARRAAGEAAAARALALPQLAGARAILVYAAMADELDPGPIAAALRSAGARIAYPRVCAPGDLMLHWSDGDDLEAGPLGIREPAESAPVADVTEIDAVLVPGAAFDDSCHRLGMGGGFYDRLLPGLHPGAVTIGLAFDEQVVDEVPTEAHDVPLDLVVTPTRTMKRPA